MRTVGSFALCLIYVSTVLILIHRALEDVNPRLLCTLSGHMDCRSLIFTTFDVFDLRSVFVLSPYFTFSWAYLYSCVLVLHPAGP